MVPVSTGVVADAKAHVQLRVTVTVALAARIRALALVEVLIMTADEAVLDAAAGGETAKTCGGDFEVGDVSTVSRSEV